jgi:small subunit ribosomal protein S6e
VLILKLNIADPKTHKTYNIEIDDKVKLSFIGKKIKEEVDLSFIDNSLKGQITGGSDKSGFPMFSSLDLEGRKKILIPNGLAFKAKRKGERKRRKVVGSIVYDNIQQLNIKLISGDSKILEEKYSKKQESKNENKEDIKK